MNQATLPPDDKKNLMSFLGGSLRIFTKRDMESLLESPQARHKIQSTPYQDVFMAVKTLGLSDSLGLLPLTLREQRRGFFDLDCWRKDNFNTASFLEWFAAFIQCGPEEAVRTARGLDPELLALFFKKNLAVYMIDPEENPPDLPLIFSPDRRYGVEINEEGDSATICRLLLDALFRFDPSLGYDLLDRVYWDNEIALEEEAYLNKRRRLEEIGFVDYYEAMEIYKESGELLSTPPSADHFEETPQSVSHTLPALLVTSLRPGQYLLEGLSKIQDTQEAERVNFELAALSNRLLSVHSVTPGDLEKIPSALEEVRDTLNLALEHFSSQKKESTSSLLLHNHLHTLFKAGFQLIAQLREQANRIFESSGRKIPGLSPLPLDSPEQEFLEGLRRFQPRFYEGIMDPRQASYRNIRTLQDLQTARHGLEQIEVLARDFWNLFPDFSLSSWHENLNLPLPEIRFSQIFCTSLLNLVLKGECRVEVLSVADMERLLTKETHLRGSSAEKTSPLKSIAHELVETCFSAGAVRDVFTNYSSRWVEAMLNELEPHWGKWRPDPRFMKTLIFAIAP
jgi:hypothetical protein